MPPKKIKSRINRVNQVKCPNLEEEQVEECVASGSTFTPVSFYGAPRAASRWAIMAQTIEDDENPNFEGFEEQQLPPEQPLPLSEEEIIPDFDGFELPPEQPLVLPLRYPKTLLLHRKALLANNRRYCASLETIATSNDQHVGMAFIPNQALLDIAKKIRCPEPTCLEFDEDTVVDLEHIQLDTKITVTCRICEEVLYRYDPVVRIDNQNLCPGTAGVVDQCMATGSGRIGAQRLAFGAGLAGHIGNHQWEKYSRSQGQKSLHMYEEHLPIVNQCVRDAAHERDVFSDDDGVMDVEVSFDGTWATRGHSSHLGMGFVIEANTGFVLDHSVLSRYCQICERLKRIHEDNHEDRDAEIALHKERGECMSNYSGVSGGMERESAVRMWRRSVDKNAMRYTQFISDGDSNAYKAVRDLDPYDGKQIEKLECVNHVSKRLGTRLRKLKQETFAVIKNAVTGRTSKRTTLGGPGKLTD